MSAASPGIGAVIVILAFIEQMVIGVMPGVKGSNQYGEDPKSA